LLAQGISAKNKQHKSNVLANQFALSSSSANYPLCFVNVIVPIKTRLLRQELSLATPIDPRINQPLPLKNLSPLSKTPRTLHPDLTTYATKCLKICPQNHWKSCCSCPTKFDSQAKFLCPGCIQL